MARPDGEPAPGTLGRPGRPGRPGRRRWWPEPLAWLIVIAGGFAIASAFDSPVHGYFVGKPSPKNNLSEMLDFAGWFPTWLIVGVALMLVDLARRRRQGLWPVLDRGLLVITAAGLSGLLAEGLKLTFRRLRPPPSSEAWTGVYEFRPWHIQPFDVGGLGLPSSHVAVAFGAAVAMALMYPTAIPVWAFLAIGCGVARVIVAAHFVSDAFLGACCGALVARLIWHWHRTHSTQPLRPLTMSGD